MKDKDGLKGTTKEKNDITFIKLHFSYVYRTKNKNKNIKIL